jgi:hypothetical protein
MSDTGPPEPGSRNGANNHERAESKAAANLARDYPTHEFAATGNYLEPGTAQQLTQDRFGFDSEPAFSDPRLAAYLQFLARELSDDGLRAFLHARFAYQRFQRLGTPECRRNAWHLVQLACRLSAKNRHRNTAGTPSNAILGQPGKPESAKGGHP